MQHNLLWIPIRYITGLGCWVFCRQWSLCWLSCLSPFQSSMSSSSPFLQMGQCGPHVHFSSIGLLFCSLGKVIAWGMAVTLVGASAFSLLTEGVCVGGIGQSALALNRFVEAGTVLGHGVSSLTWKVGALGIASDFLSLLGWIAAGSRRVFFHLGPSCGVWNSFKFPLCQNIYSHWNGCG